MSGDQKSFANFMSRSDNEVLASKSDVQVPQVDRRSPKPVMSDEEMTQLLKDALLNNRAFIAGRAFGVPEEAYPEHLKQVLEALLPVVKCVANEWDGGLEYARLYGVYPDGRKYHGSDT